MEFDGEGLIIHGRMSHQNPDNAQLGFTGDGSGDAEGNVDLNPPFCYEEGRIHAVAVPPTDLDHSLPFSQVRAATPISATPIELGTSPLGPRVPMRTRSIFPSPKTEDPPSISGVCSAIVRLPTPSPSPPTVGDKAKSIVKLRAPTITKMAFVIAAHCPQLSAALTHVISARPAAAFVATSVPDATASEIFAAASANGLDVAILDSGATLQTCSE